MPGTSDNFAFKVSQLRLIAATAASSDHRKQACYFRDIDRRVYTARPNGFSRGDGRLAGSDRAAGCAQQVRNRTEISGYHFVPFVIRLRSFYPSRWINDEVATLRVRWQYVMTSILMPIPWKNWSIMGSRLTRGSSTINSFSFLTSSLIVCGTAYTY